MNCASNTKRVSASPAFMSSPDDVPLDEELFASGSPTSSPTSLLFSSSSAEQQFAMDHLQVLLQKESSDYACIQPYTAAADDNNEIIDESWRRKICEWAFQVTDHYCFDREVTSIALYYLDRFVSYDSYNTSSGEKVGRREFQLLAITCLYVAMKLHGSIDLNLTKKRVKISLSQFVTLSHGYFSSELIEEMEMKLLTQVLKWRVNPPTSAQFMAYVLQFLLPVLQDSHRKEATFNCLFDISRFFAETGVCLSSVFICHKPSVVALASLANAIEAADNITLSPHERQGLFSKLSEIAFYFKADGQDIQRVRTLLTELCPDVCALFLSAGNDAAAVPETPQASAMSDSDTISGKRSPNCVSQGADEMCNDAHPPTKRRIFERDEDMY